MGVGELAPTHHKYFDFFVITSLKKVSINLSRLLSMLLLVVLFNRYFKYFYKSSLIIITNIFFHSLHFYVVVFTWIGTVRHCKAPHLLVVITAIQYFLQYSPSYNWPPVGKRLASAVGWDCLWQKIIIITYTTTFLSVQIVPPSILVS